MRQESIVAVSACHPAHLNAYVCVWLCAQVSSWQRGDSKNLENGDGEVNRHTNSLLVLMRKSAVPKRMVRVRVRVCVWYVHTP